MPGPSDKPRVFSVVRQALADGARKARRIARETLGEVRRAMGLGGADPAGGS